MRDFLKNLPTEFKSINLVCVRLLLMFTKIQVKSVEEIILYKCIRVNGFLLDYLLILVLLLHAFVNTHA